MPVRLGCSSVRLMFLSALSIRANGVWPLSLIGMNEPIVTKHRLPWISRLLGAFGGCLCTVVIASWCIGKAGHFLECFAIGSIWILIPATVVGSLIPTKTPVVSFVAGAIAAIMGVCLVLAMVVSRI